MIARVWRCLATPEGANGYIAYFHRSVRPHVERIAGYRGARLMRRVNGAHVEIVVTTEWESEAAVRAFSGAEMDAAVVESEALALLVHADDRVVHFTIVE